MLFTHTFNGKEITKNISNKDFKAIEDIYFLAGFRNEFTSDQDWAITGVAAFVLNQMKLDAPESFEPAKDREDAIDRVSYLTSVVGQTTTDKSIAIARLIDLAQRKLNFHLTDKDGSKYEPSAVIYNEEVPFSKIDEYLKSLA